MDFLLEALTNWLKEMLVGGIMSNLSGMFDSVNQQVADISVQVGQTPQGWNGSIFNMIENLSNSIMVPIAGVILAIVMTVDLIQMIADKNNLHDVDTWMIFKWVFKSAAAILIVTNTWNIVMGVFDMAQSVVAQAAGIINSDASIDISSVMTDLEPRLMEMDLGPLFGLWFQSLFIGITMWALYICNEGIMNIVKPCLSLVPFALILSERRFKTAGKYLVLYAVCFILERIALTSLSGLLSFIVLAVTSIMTRFAPGIMTGAYLISSTSISEFIGAMERMHITEKIVIPMSVIFRFFPTISEEYQAIRDAMKMRGIRFGGKNPFLMLEYRLVPLMVSVVKIGDELSAAALTRGLGAPVKRTNVCQIGFHVQDLIAILFCVICFALFLFQQQISF